MKMKPKTRRKQPPLRINGHVNEEGILNSHSPNFSALSSRILKNLSSSFHTLRRTAERSRKNKIMHEIPVIQYVPPSI
jgi:hypothetical protein